MMNHRKEAMKLLKQLKDLKKGDLKENLKLQKKLEKISNNEDKVRNLQVHNEIIKMTRDGEVILKAIFFIKNSGKQTFESEIMSTSKGNYLSVFLKFVESFSDEEYWSNLSYVYCLQDFVNVPHELYKELFSSKRDHKHKLMSDDDRIFFENLPAEITIYRGGGEKEKNDGYGVSWSLNKEIAQQFVNRKKILVNKELMVVYELTIPKSKAVAYFNERMEEEIIYLGN